MSQFRRILVCLSGSTLITWAAGANLSPIMAQDEPRPPRDRGPDAREGRPPQRGDDERGDEGRPPRPRRGPDGDGPGGPGPEGRGPEGMGPGERGGPGPNGFPPPGAPPRPGDDLDWKRTHDPEMFKLDKADMDWARRCRELSEDYHDAPASEKAKIKTDIETAVAKNFEIRQQRRALELKRLEQELNRLRESIARREKDKKKLIDQRISDLTDGDGDKRF